MQFEGSLSSEDDLDSLQSGQNASKEFLITIVGVQDNIWAVEVSKNHNVSYHVQITSLLTVFM